MSNSKKKEPGQAKNNDTANIKTHPIYVDIKGYGSVSKIFAPIELISVRKQGHF